MFSSPVWTIVDTMKHFALRLVLAAAFVAFLAGCLSPTAADLRNGQGGAGGPLTTAEKEAYLRFFTPDTLHSLTADITREQWDTFNQHLGDYWDEFGSLRSNRYFPVKLTYSGPDGNFTFTEVGLRTRGNTSRQIPESPAGNFRRAHFQLKFNETFDHAPDSAAYERLDQRRLLGMRALALKYSDDEQGALRELHAYTFMNRVGLPAPRAALAHLVIRITEPSGELTTVDYGYYTAIEPVNRSFLQLRWPEDNRGDLYKCLWQSGGPALLTPLSSSDNGTNVLGINDWETNYRPSYSLESNENSTPPAHAALVNFTQKLNSLNGAALKSWLDDHFEVQDYLKWMAANFLLGMPDDYRAMGNNYYLYFPKYGKAVFIPYDYDHGLGWGWRPYDTDSVGLFDVPQVCEGLAGQDFERPLADKVLAIPEYHAAYVNYVEELLDSQFTLESFMALYNAAKVKLDGLDLLGPNGTRATMAADPQVSSYFLTRISTARSAIDTERGIVPAVVLGVERLSGFSELDGVWTILRGAGEGDPAVSLEVTASGETPARVRFQIYEGATSTLLLESEDSTAPFQAAGTLPWSLLPYRLTVTAYRADNTVLATVSESALARACFDDYDSVVNNGDGTYTFRFQPAHPAYLGAAPTRAIYLRGGLTINSENWEIAIAMTDANSDGIYEVTTAAASGQQYKFFEAGADYPASIWDGLWYTDAHNALRQNAGDQNSVLP